MRKRFDLVSASFRYGAYVTALVSMTDPPGLGDTLDRVRRLESTAADHLAYMRACTV